MEKSNFLIYILGLAIIVVSVFFYTQQDAALPQKEVTTFIECLEAGYPVMESYPRQCRDSEGNNFTEDIGTVIEKQDLIRVGNIVPNQEVTSPLTITGEARGTWYFEASFPVEIQDEKGTILAQLPAQAQGEWMTEDFVPFSVTLTFVTPTTKEGKLILRKDNPSGLPEHDDSLTIPVRFQNALVEQNGSGIRGTVMLGPTCPVERIPQDPACADRPYQTKLNITAPDSSRVIKEFSSDKDGRFSVSIAPGTYVISSLVGVNMLPRCSNTDVITVTKDHYAEASVSCDTGIR